MTRRRKRFSLGQRIAIRILAFGLRREPGRRDEFSQALDRAFPRRTQEERYQMWQAVRQRAFGWADEHV